MKKILVPTDFSRNSRAGLRFALNWSEVERLDLIFVHVLHILRPLQWTDSYFLNYSKKQAETYKQRLEKFVEGVFRSMQIRPAKYSCTVIEGISADLAMMEYCKRRGDIDFICISTAGAGGLKKMLGTITGNLVTKSKVPVIAIPKNYKVKPIKKLVYATDFSNSKEELKKVVEFARPLKTSVDVLHFTWPDEAIPDPGIVESGMKKIFRFPFKLHFERPDARYSLVDNIKMYIRKFQPAVTIMFTNQDRNLLQKIFLSSKAEQLSFELKTPLLVFSKDHVRRA